MRNQMFVTITTCCVVSEHRDYQLHLQTIFFSPGREPISFELLSLAIICFSHSQGAVLWQRGVCHSYDLLHGFRTQIFLVASSDNFFFHLDENRSLLNCSHWPFFVSAIRLALFCGREEFVTLTTCCMVSEHRYFQLHLQIIFFFFTLMRTDLF